MKENQEKQQIAATEQNLSVAAHGTEVTFSIPDTASLAALDDMEQDFSLTLKYKTAEDWAMLKNQEIFAYYMGLKDIPNKEGELVKCGVFVTKSECFISGQLTLIEAVTKLTPGTPISIIYRERKSNKVNPDHSTMIFDVATTKQKRQ